MRVETSITEEEIKITLRPESKLDQLILDEASKADSSLQIPIARIGDSQNSDLVGIVLTKSRIPAPFASQHKVGAGQPAQR